MKDTQAFAAAVLRLQGASYEEIAGLLGITREEAVENVQRAARSVLDEDPNKLSEFFTYDDDITEHVILCHETCEESYDVNREKDRGGRPSIAYLVEAAQEHVCGDGKWKKE